VNWSVHNYFWPDPALGTPGHLTIRPLKLTGRIRSHDPAALLQAMLQGRFRSYHDGGVIYHGCVARSQIERARQASEGIYFWTATPDVFASVRNLMLLQTPIVTIAAPLTLGGASPRSNGATWKRYSAGEQNAEKLEFARFIEESRSDPCNGMLPGDCASLTLLTLDALLLSFRMQGTVPDLGVSGWRQKVEKDIARMPQEIKAACRRDFETLIASLRPGADCRPGLIAPAPAPAPKPAPVVGTGAPPAQNRVRRNAPTRITLRGGATMATVLSAAAELDRLTGLDRPTNLDPTLATRAANLWKLSRAATAAARTNAMSASTNPPQDGALTQGRR
jgi:hypothetical protein